MELKRRKLKEGQNPDPPLSQQLFLEQLGGRPQMCGLYACQDTEENLEEVGQIKCSGMQGTAEPMPGPSNRSLSTDSPTGHVLSTSTEDTNKRNTLYFCLTCKAWFDAHHECSASEDPGQTEAGTERDSSTMSATDKGNWSKEATLFLIQEYRKYEEKVKSGSLRQKVLCEKIASSMQGNGYSFNGDQVAGRWKTLIRGYKNVKDHNSKSGNNPKTYEYEGEFDNIFGDDPSVMPKVTDSSLKRPRAVDNDETEESSSSSSIEMPKSEQKRARRSHSAHVVDMLKTYIEQQNTRQAEEAERRERMHRERLSVIESLVKAVIEKK